MLSPRIDALVLAAGRSRRAGGPNKLLLPWQDKAVVAHASNTGCVYASADTLDLVVGGAQDTAGKVRVWAIMCDISGVDETDRN